ncbi:sulfotransferase 1B1-like [Ptychodera flava]|uniref:sulfotransferase 1B1-like n=1 Tax=Ptychodera flava TaxID=63121 RepID=UPI00396A76B4
MATAADHFTVDGYAFLRLFDKKKLESRAADKFQFRPNDVVVASFPKSGTTWLIEILKAMYGDWGLLKVGHSESAIFLEEQTLYSSYLGKIRQHVVETINIDDLPSPRLIYTHLPATIFPCQALKDKGVKLIYICRNPKDVVVSQYYFWKAFIKGAYSTGSWEQTLQSFQESRLQLTPWVRHVGDWYQKGIKDNVLHVTYEEMKEDLPRVVDKIAEFLQRPVTKEDIERVVTTTAVDAMRNKLSNLAFVDEGMVSEGENPFVRKGTVGDWKNHFTVAQSERFDAIIGEKVKSVNRNIPYQ